MDTDALPRQVESPRLGLRGRKGVAVEDAGAQRPTRFVRESPPVCVPTVVDEERVVPSPRENTTAAQVHVPRNADGVRCRPIAPKGEDIGTVGM